MRLRLLADVTQQELADALGVARNTVSRWETGRAIPTLTIEQTKKLCEKLKVSLDQIPNNFGPTPIHPSSPFFRGQATDIKN